jgi:polysaccharide deacetylase 2 family uncharacterized protein YibQ
LATDDLDAPLGTEKKRKSAAKWKLPFGLPQLVAGALGACVAAVSLWTVLAKDPYGGEPVAVVATRMGSAAAATDRNVAAATARQDQAGSKATHDAATTPGSKVITITDGSSGKSQQVVVPPRPGSGVQQKAPVDPQLLEDSRHGQIPKIAADGRRASVVYARPVKLPPDKTDSARIAIVLGGLGISTSATAEALEMLPAAVTFAFAPYGAGVENLADNARARDHEVLLQAPMEPFDYPDNDPGPQTLLTALTPAQNIDRLQWLMNRIQGYVGIASLMGSRFTASDQALSPVLREIAKRGLIYVDDGSSARSVAGQIAGAQNLPFAKADIVLDAVPAPAEIDHALARAELMAREHGGAIAFANASPVSIARIAEWAKGVTGRGFVLVPISMMTAKPKSS